MKNSHFIPSSHSHISKSISTIMDFVTGVIDLYEEECLKKWAGKKEGQQNEQKNMEEEPKQWNCPYEASQDDLLAELRKIKNGEYNSPRKNPKANRKSNAMNKTFDDKFDKSNENKSALSNTLGGPAPKGLGKSQKSWSKALGEYLYIQ